MISSTLLRAGRQSTARALAARTSAAVPMRLESTSTMHENDPNTLEREKQRNLSGNQHKSSTPHEHAPGWNEYLASASEAAVKADRSEGGLDELQERTTKHLRARRHADEEDASDNNTKAEPDFQKEEVKGPLGAAKGDVAKPNDRSGGVSGGKP